MPMEEAEIHRPVINTQRKDVPTSQTESISGASVCFKPCYLRMMICFRKMLPMH